LAHDIRRSAQRRSAGRARVTRAVNRSRRPDHDQTPVLLKVNVAIMLIITDSGLFDRDGA
jgi:hypothetical protein